MSYYFKLTNIATNKYQNQIVGADIYVRNTEAGENKKVFHIVKYYIQHTYLRQ